jgi:hypothetical protein
MSADLKPWALAQGVVHFLDVHGIPDEYQIKGSICYEPAAILNAERVELGIPKDSLIIPY